MKTKSILLMLAVCAGGSFIPQLTRAQGNLITDGSFENALGINSTTGIGNLSAAWTESLKSIYAENPAEVNINANSMAPGSGDYLLPTDGSIVANVGFTSTLSQSVNLTAGYEYVLAFDYYAGPFTVSVSNGSDNHSFNTSGFSDSNWTAASYDFTAAQSGAYDVAFTANEVDPYLDNVRLTVVPVPEPSTLALAGLGGLAGFGFCRRRK